MRGVFVGLVVSKRKSNYLLSAGMMIAVAIVIGGIGLSRGSTAYAADPTPTAESYFTFSAGVITDYDGVDGPKDVVIPSTIGGEAVTSIGQTAFQANGLTSVWMPDSVTSIQMAAFTNNAIETVRLSESLLTIAPAAFFTNQLTELFIPSSVTSIGGSSFTANPITSLQIGDSSFTGTPTLALTPGGFDTAGLESLILGNNVLSVTALFSNTQLSYLDLGDSIQTIQSGAFSNNPLLTSVTFPDSIRTLSGGVFSSNSQLESIDFGEGVETISGSFTNNNMLTSVTLPVSCTQLSFNSFSNSTVTSIILQGTPTLSNMDNLSLNVAKTGTYISLLTSDPANPTDYQDMDGIYIVNPAQVTVEYVDANGNELLPATVETGETLDSYLVSDNPSADFSLYYRSGDVFSAVAPTIEGYTAPQVQARVLAPGENVITLQYAPIVVPGVPNTGAEPAQGQPLATIILTSIAALTTASIALYASRKPVQ